jgi:hypothetical protein
MRERKGTHHSAILIDHPSLGLARVAVLRLVPLINAVEITSST